MCASGGCTASIRTTASPKGLIWQRLQVSLGTLINAYGPKPLPIGTPILFFKFFANAVLAGNVMSQENMSLSVKAPVHQHGSG